MEPGKSQAEATPCRAAGATLPEVAGRLATDLPVDEVHNARIRDLLQEAGQARGAGRGRILPATLSAVLAAAEPFVDPMAGQHEMERLRAAVVAWVAEGRPV